MKSHFEFKVLMLISLCTFAWSGWIYAQNEAAWNREDPGRIWTVTLANKDHMEVGDMFTIVRDQQNEQIKLLPDPVLKGRWNSNMDQVGLTEVVINNKNFLCGFVNVDTVSHTEDYQENVPRSMTGHVRHGKWHGILIKVIAGNKNKLMIVWSPRPLGRGALPDPANCQALDSGNHGGMAHANG